VKFKGLAVPTDPRLREYHPRCSLRFSRDPNGDQQRAEKQDSENGGENIDQAFGRGINNVSIKGRHGALFYTDRSRGNFNQFFLKTGFTEPLRIFPAILRSVPLRIEFLKNFC